MNLLFQIIILLCLGRLSQVKILDKVAVSLKRVDESSILHFLQTRLALDNSVIQSILVIREDIDRRKAKFLEQLRIRASVPTSGFLNSLYLSLLDSCETSALEINFDVANDIRRQGKLHFVFPDGSMGIAPL